MCWLGKRLLSLALLGPAAEHVTVCPRDLARREEGLGKGGGVEDGLVLR